MLKVFVLLQVLIFVYASPVYQLNEVFTNSAEDHILLKKGSYLNSTGSKCECFQYSCGCCVFMDVPRLHLNDSGCVNMTYLPNDYGLTVTVTIDKWAIFNETISARSPPPLCFGEDYLPVGALLCLKFYDLDVTKTSFHACTEIYARFHHVEIAKYDLGCFNIGHISLFNRKRYFEKPFNGTKTVYIPKKFSYVIP